MKKMKVTYFTGVKKPCGYHQEMVTAIAEKISDKMCKIISAEMEPAKVKRQQYNTKFWAELGIGKQKRIANLYSVDMLKEQNGN